MKEITKETIDRIMLEVAEEFEHAPQDRFSEVLNGLPDDKRNDPYMIALVASASTQSNMLLIIKEVLYKLLGE